LLVPGALVFKKSNKPQLILKVISIGGTGCRVQTGNIQKDRRSNLDGLEDHPLFMLLLKMQKHMQNGPVKNYQQKQNGNLQREAD
jgi:hypothetical protein